MAHSSEILIGRDTELAALAATLGVTGAPASRGVVLLAGDAGVGKTRLLMELRDLARAAGWRVLAGHCLDFGESALPYLPFSEVLGRFAADLPDLLERVGAMHPAITRLQPGRRVRDAADGASGDREGSHGADRAELFEAVRALLDAAAADAPLLLVVEDTHWADHSTRDLLGFLFTRGFDHQVSIVASYRSDDLHRRHPLRRQVAEWARLQAVERVVLAPLPDHAVRRLVRELAPPGLSPANVPGIVERAEGNAFFVEELVASGGGWLPDDLADLLLVRLDGLGEGARRVVRIASVAGRKVSHALLEAAADLPPDELESGIRQAVEMNVLVAGTGSYAFRHALLGEAVYDDLLPGERVRLHAQYVEALTALPGRGTAAELARHARRAMDLDRAATAAIEAGDEAGSVGGPEEAARHYEHALELLAEVDRAERLGIDVSKVVLKAAEALQAGGDTQRAADLLAAHLDRLGPDGAPAARSRLMSRYAIVLAFLESGKDFVAISREAVALAPEGESPLRARVLSDHARVLASADRLEEAEAVGTEALALAELLAMPSLASEVVTTLSGLRVRLAPVGERDAVHAALRDAVDRAARADAVSAEMRARFLLGRFHQDLAEWGEAARWFESAMRCGERAGLPWAPYSLEARWQLAAVSYAVGDFDRVLALLSVVDDDSGPLVLRALIEPWRLSVAADRGEPVAADLARLRKVWADEGGVAVFGGGLEIEVAARRGDVGTALEAYDAVSTLLARIWEEHYAARLRHATLAIAAIAAGIQEAPSAERPGLVERADRLRWDGEAVVAGFRDRPGTWGPEGQAWEQRLRAEQLRVHWVAGIGAPERADLLEAWAATVAAFERLGNVPELAKVRVVHAGILRLLGDHTGARAAGDAARETAHRLGMQPLLDALRALGSERARASTPASTVLTARESEVLGLVAEGRSNGEIGKQLYISTKTVSVHVSNILAKLGAAGRSEAAAIARRQGLLE